MIQFLSYCKQIEECVGSIYQEFAANPGCDAELKLIWEKMAREEQDHSMQIQLAMRLPFTETFHEGLAEECPDLQELLARGREVLAEARTAPFSVLKMLQTAIELEKEFLKVHAPCALRFKNASLKKTFEALARGDRHHTEALAGYIKKFKAAHARQA